MKRGDELGSFYILYPVTFGEKRNWVTLPFKERGPVIDPEDPNKPENLRMLKSGQCKGINGIPCTGKIRIDKTGAEGLA